MEPIIEVKHLKKSFGDLEVLHDIDFTVSKGEVVTIIGASGSGKSTFLRCLNILETPNGGSVMYHGKDILKGEINVNVHREECFCGTVDGRVLCKSKECRLSDL